MVKTLDAVIAPPLGLGLLGGEPQIAEERLEPGDRILLYTDGVVEARNASGTFFGAGQGFVRVALVPTLGECEAAVDAWRKA